MSTIHDSAVRLLRPELSAVADAIQRTLDRADEVGVNRFTVYEVICVDIVWFLPDEPDTVRAVKPVPTHLEGVCT